MSLPTHLTPTEELMLEVIVARVRTGEQLWTFNTRFTAVAESLTNKGYVNWKSGIVEKTILVWLTKEANEELITPKWKIPLLKNYVKKSKYDKLVKKLDKKK